MKQKIEISSKTIVFTVGFLLFLKLLWQIKELILSLLLAFILMSALKPIVRFLEKLKIPRTLATVFVFVFNFFFFYFLGIFIIPPLVKESLLFLKNLPFLISNLLPNTADFFDIKNFSQFLPDLTQNVFKVVTSFFSNFIFISSVIFFTFYFLIEEKFLVRFLEKFFEKKQAEEIANIFYKAEKRLAAWFWGELILMLVIGLASYIGLTLLKIRYALPLAIIAGLLEIIPIIGPTLSALPAFFVAASSSWWLGISVIALYFLIQQLENNLIVPLVMKKTVGLNPIFTLIALTIGGKIGGVIGVLLSVPIALVLETVLQEIIQLKGKDL